MNGEACVKCAGGIWWPWPHEIYRHSPTDGRNNYDATHYKASFPFSCCLSSFWVHSRHSTTADGCSKYATFFDYYLFEIVKRKWKLGMRKRNQDSRCGRLATAQRIKYDYEGAVRIAVTRPCCTILILHLSDFAVCSVVCVWCACAPHPTMLRYGDLASASYRILQPCTAAAAAAAAAAER